MHMISRHMIQKTKAESFISNKTYLLNTIWLLKTMLSDLIPLSCLYKFQPQGGSQTRL